MRPLALRTLDLGLRASLLLLTLSLPVPAQELKLECRLLWVGESCRKTLPVLFNPLSPGFCLDNVNPDSGSLRVAPQIDELDKNRVRQTLDYHAKGWSEVESRSIVLNPGERQILPVLDEVIVPGDSWPLHLPVGSEIDLQHLQREGVAILKVTCRGFSLRMNQGQPLCRWSTTTREFQLLPNKTYSFAGLVNPDPPLDKNSWPRAGYATLADQRAELILFIEER